MSVKSVLLNCQDTQKCIGNRHKVREDKLSKIHCNSKNVTEIKKEYREKWNIIQKNSEKIIKCIYN